MTLVDRPDRHYRVLAHVAVTVLEALAHCRNQWLKDFLLLDLLEKTQGGASDVFVGVLKVVPDGVAYQDHLLLQLALGIKLGAHFPVELEHLLELLVLAWEYILDDRHQERRVRLAIQRRYDNGTERLQLDLIVLTLKVRTELLCRHVQLVASIRGYQRIRRWIRGHREASRIVALRPGAPTAGGRESGATVLVRGPSRLTCHVPSTGPLGGQRPPHWKNMAGRPVWRTGRALYAVGVRFRTLSSAASQPGKVDVVEKVALRMLAQREALLQNVGDPC